MMSIKPRFSRYMESFFSGLKWILVVVVFVAFVGGLIWSNQVGCEGDRDRAKSVLESAGYKKIEVGGARGWRCGEGDGESNEFTAIGPSGKYAEGVVCCSREGCRKGCTIRIEP